MCRKKVFYQGTEGSYSHIVSGNFFGEGYEFVGLETFRDIFTKIGESDSSLAVIPVENSLAGSVFENFDLLNQFRAWIIGESFYKVRHNLLGFRDPKLTTDQNIERVKKVFSHYKALEQCADFFLKHPEIQPVIYSDTAGAAKFVKENNDPSLAAIAGKEAAELYGLDILKSNLEDNQENYTRFFVIQSHKPKQLDFSKLNKCSLVFIVKHEPGSLLRVIEVFARHKYNLSKIESRPIHGKFFEYFFYMDFEFDLTDKNTFNLVIDEFAKYTQWHKIMGIYPSGKSMLDFDD
jgi:prephenate dehydratase